MVAKKTGLWSRNLRQYTLAPCLVVFVWLAVIAARGPMGALEQDVFRAIYTLPDDLRVVALVVTQFGSAWVLLGLTALLLVLRKNPALSVAVLRNGVFVYICVVVAKFFVHRPRPMRLLADVAPREVIVYGLGFPSAHTALATVISLTILPCLPKKWRWLPLVWIVLVGWSRIYLGVHSPLDVLGGFVLGTLVVLVFSSMPQSNTSQNKKRPRILAKPDHKA